LRKENLENIFLSFAWKVMRASMKAESKDCNVHKGRAREENEKFVREAKKNRTFRVSVFSTDGGALLKSLGKIRKFFSC
jgi:hypothetical protein